MTRPMPSTRPLRLPALAALLLALALPAAAQSAAAPATGSRITAVKLYPGSATVQRTLRVARARGRRCSPACRRGWTPPACR